MPKLKHWLSFSSGKDSAWALYVLNQQGVKIEALFCTINQVQKRVSLHGTNLSVLEAQADALGLPLIQIPLPDPCSNETYEKIMFQFSQRCISEGVTHIVFGDLFLEDIRQYREKNFQNAGLKTYYPLWKKSTKMLAEAMLSDGLRAKIVAIDPCYIPEEFLGAEFDTYFLNHLKSLPHPVDPCGENGEFHTLVYDHPMFYKSISIQLGRIHKGDYYHYIDIF